MLKKIQAELRKNSDAKAKDSIFKFVPHSQRVYGLKMIVVNDLAGKYKEGGFELVEQLWGAGAFEERLLAAKMLGKIARKDPLRTLELIYRFSDDITDWAVCDTLGMQSPRPINRSHSNEVFELAEKLVASENAWQRRLGIVLVEWYTRDKSFHKRIRDLLARVDGDKEYYVKKAVVWINRNFEKRR